MANQKEVEALALALEKFGFTSDQIRCLSQHHTLADIRNYLIKQRYFRSEDFFDTEDGSPTFTVEFPLNIREEILGEITSQRMYRGEEMIRMLESIPLSSPVSGLSVRLGVVRAVEFGKRVRNYRTVYQEGLRRGWLAPPAETALLIHRKLSESVIKGMGLTSLIVMHEPITVWSKQSGIHERQFQIHKGSLEFIDSMYSDCLTVWGGTRWGFVFLVPTEDTFPVLDIYQ